MLKASPLIPWAYIAQSSKIGPKKGRQYVLRYVQKSSKIKKVDNGLTNELDCSAMGPR